MQQGVVLEAVEAAAREDGALRLVLVQGQLWAYGDYESTPLHARFRYYVEFLQVGLCGIYLCVCVLHDDTRTHLSLYYTTTLMTSQPIAPPSPHRKCCVPWVQQHLR